MNAKSTLLTGLLVLLAAQISPAAGLSDEALLAFVKERATKAERVTGKAAAMDPRTALLCAKPAPKPVSEDPHWNALIHVWTNEGATGPVWDPPATFPEGAMLVKEKLNQKQDGAELFTGMVKREKGYNPEGGDWEYFLVDGAAEKVTDRGLLKNCIDCHAKYKEQDFVTKEYTCRSLGNSAVHQMGGGSVILHACRATVTGEKLRYEPQPHKNTLGFWVNQADWAAWSLEIDKPGTFEVEITQGCGTGHGGSEVELTLEAAKDGKPQTIPFVVEDTGGFQNWKKRVIGRVTVEKGGSYTLSVKPKMKKGGAVMDLQRVKLAPVKG